MGEFVRVAGTDDVKPGHGLVAEVNSLAGRLQRRRTLPCHR